MKAKSAAEYERQIRILKREIENLRRYNISLEKANKRLSIANDKLESQLDPDRYNYSKGM